MSNDGKTAVVIFGGDSIWQLDDKPGTLYWTCPLMVDADGSPHAYHPDGSPPGLDYLANAGSPGNWWGIATDSGGDPYIQKDTDVAPGFYVSTTALIDGAWPTSSPNKYVDSELWPFIVLPSSPKFSDRQQLGDLCMCFNNRTGRSSWAIYADIGPSNEIGEGSMALCDALGVDSDPKSGGTDSEDIAMVYFSGSRIGWPRDADELAAKAHQLFRQWGGFASCRIAMPQFNWDQFEPAPPAPHPVDKPTVIVIAPPGVHIRVVKDGSR